MTTPTRRKIARCSAVIGAACVAFFFPGRYSTPLTLFIFADGAVAVISSTYYLCHLRGHERKAT
jgi:hypothetical protein